MLVNKRCDFFEVEMVEILADFPVSDVTFRRVSEDSKQCGFRSKLDSDAVFCDDLGEY